MTEAGCGSPIRNAPSLRLGRVAEWQHPARLVAGLLAHGVAEVPRDSPSRSPADGGVASLFLANCKGRGACFPLASGSQRRHQSRRCLGRDWAGAGSSPRHALASLWVRHSLWRDRAAALGSRARATGSQAVGADKPSTSLKEKDVKRTWRAKRPFQRCANSLIVTPKSGARAGIFRNGETQIRTGDTTIFSRVLYQLSYLAADRTSIGIRCYCFSNSSTSAS